MARFRDYNLIRLVEELQSSIVHGQERGYLRAFSPEVRFELITNFTAIADTLSIFRTKRGKYRTGNSKLL